MMLAMALLAVTGLSHSSAALAESMPDCNQERYISGVPYFDPDGFEWNCRRNYAGRYVWVVLAKNYGDPMFDPPCDDDHIGAIWHDFDDNYFKCEYTVFGPRWEPVRNPFASATAADPPAYVPPPTTYPGGVEDHPDCW